MESNMIKIVSEMIIGSNFYVCVYDDEWWADDH